VLGYCKLCELEDFADPDLRRYKSQLVPEHERDRVHRKYWEFAQSARALVELRAVHRKADVLGVAAGAEATTFWLTNHAHRVFATDRYLEPAGWEIDAPRSMLLTPGQHAAGAWNPRRLVVQHMDARELQYEDASFDAVYSSGSIEHFGDHSDLGRALAEMVRVLKPGGIAALSSEYRLRGPGPGLPGTLLFSADEIDELIVRPYAWELVQPLDVRLSEATLATELQIPEAVRLQDTSPEVPHIVLADGDLAMTSVHLVLRKQRRPRFLRARWP
jgi:SAM-dependent methyltransferase